MTYAVLSAVARLLHIIIGGSLENRVNVRGKATPILGLNIDTGNGIWMRFIWPQEENDPI